MKYRNDLTVEQVRELLDYDPETGVFTWRASRGCMPKGAKAGNLDPINTYWRVGIDGYLYLAHRLAWFHYYGEWPADQIDHINCQRSDNRIQNFREANRSENTRNISIQSNNTSGFKGVMWDKRRGCWLARIQLFGKKYDLGHFRNKQEAHTAYCKAATELHGEFARTA